jgi:hypothetical protein
MLFLKDRHARLDYRVDWAAMCGDGRTIASSEWRLEPSAGGGVLIVGSDVEGTSTRVWIEGGRDGEVVALVNHVAFSDGSIDERSVTVRVGER